MNTKIQISSVILKVESSQRSYIETEIQTFESD